MPVITKENTIKLKKPKRRSLSAYNFFCQEEKNRDVIKLANPEWDPAQVLKKLGSNWKSLPDDQKTPYQEKANIDKEEFELSKINNPDIDPHYTYDQVLKLAKSSYMHYSNDSETRNKIKKQHPEWKVTEIASHLGSTWNKMSGGEKLVWQNKADEEKISLKDNPIYVTKKKKKLLPNQWKVLD